MEIAGVDYVEIKRFQRWGRLPDREIDRGVLVTASTEIIRLDNDPNFAENGKIEFQMRGGFVWLSSSLHTASPGCGKIGGG